MPLILSSPSEVRAVEKFKCYAEGWFLGIYEGHDALDCARLAGFEHGYDKWEILCVACKDSDKIPDTALFKSA